MSTFGRGADRAAKLKRERERIAARKKQSTRDVIAIALSALNDRTISDKIARGTALIALLSIEFPL